MASARGDDQRIDYGLEWLDRAVTLSYLPCSVAAAWATR
jgi:hypothetical protein